MSISTPPPPPKKKSGCGCLGCGCGLLAVLILLFFGLVGSAGYFGYTGFVKVTTPTPGNVPAFTATDEAYAAVQQKMGAMQHDVKDHQSATIHLSADDINTLIAHNPDIAKNNIHTFVTLSGSEGRMQASVPTDALTHGLVKDRYLNFDIAFGISFDPQTKSIGLLPHTLKVGDNYVLGGNVDTVPGANMNKQLTSQATPYFTQSFNQGLRQNPNISALLDQAKSIQIENGELVIVTQ